MEGTNTMLAAPAPLMSTDGNVRTRRSRRGGRRCHARRSSPEAHSAARWPALVQGALRQERASKRTGILQSWMRLQAARAKIRRFLWRYWTLRVVTLDTIHEITEGRACPDHPFSHPLGFEVLAPLSLRDRWIFLRANRLAFHVPAARTSSRHVLDWLRKPFCGGPHWLHQDRLQFWLDADGGRSWDYPDSEEDSEDYNTDGSDDLDLPEHLRPSDAEMARRAARYPLPI